MSEDIKLVGSGRYLAYEEYFACQDERGQDWRLSRITLNSDKPGDIHFSYIGKFQTQTEIEMYIATH